MKKIVKELLFMEKEDVLNLKKQMLELGILTFSELSKKCNCSQQYISAIVTGRRNLTNNFFKKLKEIGIIL